MISPKPSYEELEQKVKNLTTEASEHDRMEKEVERIFNFSLDMIGSGNLQGYFTKINSSFMKILGYTQKEILEKPFIEFVHDDDVEKTKQALADAAKGKNEIYIENRYKGKDGSYRWIEWKVLSIVKKNTFIAVGRDVTARKQVEEVLRESEEKFRTIFISAPLGIAIARPDGRFIEVNDSGCRMLGYSNETLKEMSFLDITYPDDRGEIRELADKVWDGKNDFYQAEKRYLKKDGSPLWATINASAIRDSRGKVQYWIGIMQDISQRKQAEDALKESEEQYRLLMNNLPGIVFKGFKDWSVEFYDNRIEGLTGYNMHQFNSGKKKWLDLIVKEDAESAKQTFIKALKTDKSYVRNYRLVIKDGNIIWIQERGYIVCNPNGDIEYVSGVFYDITDRKEAEEDKKKLEDQLLQAQKMESIGTLAGGIAHDFNNILGIILGNTELAMDDVSEWHPARHNLQEVQTAGLRAKDVVRQLLSFARKTRLEKKPTNVIPIIKESLDLMRSSIPTSIEIRQNMPKDIDTILADPTQIAQILINLSTNADHAMPDGGILEISLKNLELDKDNAVQHPDLGPGRYVHLTVSDTGHGISQEEIDRVFDPYFTTKEIGKGTGLGLSVIHGIVKSHGGVISIESELGRGTTFHIYFPVTDKEEVIETESAEELPTGNEKILFIDDEESIGYVGRIRLEQLGYQVETRMNPVEALELFRSQPDQFDLIITDMTMPKMTGDKLTREILNIRPKIPIILCTGFSEKINGEKAKEIGAAGYLDKPHFKRDLAIRVRQALDGK